METETRKTKTMKAIQLWIMVLVLILSSSACTKDDPVDPRPEPQPLILKGKDAVEWTKNHLDSLVNVYMADCGNLLDPDMTRDLLKCIGYTRLNVFDYREAGWLIDSVVFIRLISRSTRAVWNTSRSIIPTWSSTVWTTTTTTVASA